MTDDHQVGRRRFIQIGAGALAAAGTGAARAAGAPPVADTGRVADGRVEFPSWTAPTERPSGGPPEPVPPGQRVGFAVLGLGRLALEEIIPAFAMAKHARLVALVSGTPDKARLIAAQYGVKPGSVYSYDEFDKIRENPEVEVVYVVTPNGLHREHTERAAAAGKHVLCEKPMATSSPECRAMIEACRRADRKLMIAYRCQYEPNNRAILGLVREKSLGALRLIDAVNVQNMGDPAQWRFRRALAGGGALPDVGLYCLNAARFLTGEEPVEVFGRTLSPAGDPRYAEVEETVQFTLRFPSGTIANCAASYGMHEARQMRLYMPAGTVNFENAFAYQGQNWTVGHRDGAAESVDDKHLMPKNQFALEMDHMAQCVRTGGTPHTPGEEGLADQIVTEAIYRSAASGQPVALAPVDKPDATRGPAPNADL